MGLYIREPGEAVFCGICGKCILGTKALIAKTTAGTPVCPKCIELLHLTSALVPTPGSIP